MLWVYKGLKFAFRHLVPECLRYPLVRVVARLAYWLDGRRRRTVIRNLLPLVGPERAPAVAARIFESFGLNSVDFFCPDIQNESIQVEGEATLLGALKRQAKVMVVTAHFGNWEIGMRYLASLNIPLAGLYAIYREDPVVDWILQHRDPQVEWIAASRGAAEASINALNQGRTLGLLADIPFGEPGTRVRICSTPVRLPLGPWAIASRAGATVVPAFVLRDRPGAYRVIFHDAIEPVAGSFRTQMKRLQERYRSLLENYLTLYPEQWGLLQPFWESR